MVVVIRDIVTKIIPQVVLFLFDDRMMVHTIGENKVAHQDKHGSDHSVKWPFHLCRFKSQRYQGVNLAMIVLSFKLFIGAKNETSAYRNIYIK